MVVMFNIDRHIAIQAGWIAGPAFGVAMMAAPDYLKLERPYSGLLFWGGIGVFLLTLAVVGLLSVYEERKRKTMVGSILVMAIGALIFCGGAAWYFWPMGTQELIIDPEFVEVHRLSSRLGKATSNAFEGGVAYQARYEHAMVIWLESLLTFYIFPDDRTKSAIVQKDSDWSADPRLTNDVELRKLFPKIRRDKNPPYAGIANQWLRNPKEWEWLGAREWHCSYAHPGIRYQIFANGIIVGAFRLNIASNVGQAFAIANDDTWNLARTNSVAANCTIPK
jgi:hypothetical protein